MAKLKPGPKPARTKTPKAKMKERRRRASETARAEAAYPQANPKELPATRKELQVLVSTGLRQQWLEAYAARGSTMKRDAWPLQRINRELGVSRAVLDVWYTDPDFLEQTRAIDTRRLEAALAMVSDGMPQVLERQLRIAAAVPDPKPKPPQSKSKIARLEYRMDLSAWLERDKRRYAASTRAAALLTDIMGLRSREALVNVYQQTVEGFGGMPQDVPGLVAENERLDKVYEMAKAELERVKNAKVVQAQVVEGEHGEAQGSGER